MSFDLSSQLEAIYRFCRARCFTSVEAEDMAQEILLTAWTHRARLESADNPAAYLGGICRNVYKMTVRQRKQEKLHMFFVNSDEALAGIAQEGGVEDASEFMELRGRIVNLAREHRELIVAHYFDGKSVKELSQLTGMPEGTVKWRLMLARQCMKKEWNDMEWTLPLKPVQIEMGLSGSPPSHNIVPELTTPTRRLLLWLLQTPLTAKEAAARTGVPTMLVEEELSEMLALEAVGRQPDGKYFTSFYIETLEYIKRRDALIEKHAPALREAVLSQFDALKEELFSIGFSKGGRSVEELTPTFIMHMLHDGDVHWPELSYYKPPLRPDGGCYYFMCREYAEKPVGLRIYDWYGGIPGLEYRTCVPGDTPVMDRIGAAEEKVAAVCKQLHDTGNLEGTDSELIATLIAAGAVKKENGALTLAVPWFTRGQFNEFSALMPKLVEPLSGKIRAFLIQVEDLLREAMPPHLLDQMKFHSSWAAFDLFAEIMKSVWPEDMYAAAGLLLVEE